MTEEKRIYSVVAQTVQAPLEPVPVRNAGLKYISAGNYLFQLKSTEETKTSVQPAGRIVAQHGHAVSMVRERMLKEEILRFLNQSGKQKGNLSRVMSMCHTDFEPITTIVLGARDSFELNHVFNLLDLAKIPTYAFYDSNQQDYGDPEWKVMTAIATEPVTPDEVVGILDYLPLWKP